MVKGKEGREKKKQMRSTKGQRNGMGRERKEGTNGGKLRRER